MGARMMNVNYLLHLILLFLSYVVLKALPSAWIWHRQNVQMPTQIEHVGLREIWD